MPPPFARFSRDEVAWLRVQIRRAFMGRCWRGIHLSTPGVLGSGSSSVVSIHPCLLRPHAPVPQARCVFAYRLYAAPSLCGSASATRRTFPTFTTVLSMHVADPTPAVRRILPLYSYDDSRLPQSMNESSPAIPSLPAILTGYAISGLHRSLDVTTCMFALPSATGYDAMKSRALHPAF